MMPRALFAIALLGCSLTPSTATTQPAAAAATDAGLGYVVRVTGGAREDARLPMLVAVHGLGDTPEAFLSLFDTLSTPARVIALRAPMAYGEGFAWFPPGAVERDPAPFARAVEAVAAALPVLVRRFPTCRGPVVTGFSQGGMLAFALAARHPQAWRAAVPIAGRLPVSLRPGARRGDRSLPEVVALHGTADLRIAFDQGETAVGTLREAGFPAVMHPFAGVGHTIPGPMRADLMATLGRILGDC